ncbi:MAG: AAA family ATPase [Thermoanaerobaculia bacterium]|nr:AAA family ATPase [Thermoanaerobaculia bacterium]
MHYRGAAHGWACRPVPGRWPPDLLWLSQRRRGRSPARRARGSRHRQGDDRSEPPLRPRSVGAAGDPHRAGGDRRDRKRARRENLALGSTPNIAARLESLAEPNTVVLSEATYRLVSGFFSCRSLGQRFLKGVSRPMEIFQAIARSSARSRFEVVETRGLGALVARRRETRQLLDCLHRSHHGHGQCVWLEGEAGIGKSRLVRMLREHARESGHVFLLCQSSPFHSNSPLYPAIELLGQQLCHLRNEDTAAEKLDKLERFCERLALRASEQVPLWATLLDVPVGDRYAPLELSPQRQKEKVLESLLEVLWHVAKERPLLFVIEDLHWTDPSTLEFLQLLLREVPSRPILVLLTSRSACPWPGSPVMTEIVLGRLSREATESLIQEITGGKRLPAVVIRQLVEKTDGVPLFVEELTRMVMESDLVRAGEGGWELAGPQLNLAIPATLQDSLTARLDRLSTVKEVAQLASILGRRFSFELLQRVSARSEAVLQRDLARLVEAQLLVRQGTGVKTVYVFRHALIQEAAYHMLLRSTRQKYHAQVAQILIEQFSEVVAAEPEVIAQHYTEAGLAELAVDYWRQAGERANRRSSHQEAIHHLTKALELLAGWEQSPARDRLELSLQMSLGTAIIALRGYTTPELAHAYGRAQVLCERAGAPSEHFWVLVGLSLYHFVRADMEEGLRLSRRLVELAEPTHDPVLMSAAFYQLGATFFFMGELTASLDALDRALALVPADDASQRERFGHDVRVMSLAIGALVSWLLGHPDRSLDRGRSACT